MADVKIEKIDIKVGEKVISLTVEEAKGLRGVLNGLFAEPFMDEICPLYPPVVYPWTYPWYGPTPGPQVEPYTTWTTTISNREPNNFGREDDPTTE